MKDFLKHYSLLIFLLLLVIILILIKIFYGKNNETIKSNSITPTPTLNLTPTETIKDRDNYGDEDVGSVSLIPYEGKKMVISRYIKTGVLEVLIKKEEDKPEAELEVQEWLKISGYKTGEIEFVYKISDF